MKADLWSAAQSLGSSRPSQRRRLRQHTWPRPWRIRLKPFGETFDTLSCPRVGRRSMCHWLMPSNPSDGSMESFLVSMLVVAVGERRTDSARNKTRERGIDCGCMHLPRCGTSRNVGTYCVARRPDQIREHRGTSGTPYVSWRTRALHCGTN
jgi:hypothetical protein